MYETMSSLRVLLSFLGVHIEYLNDVDELLVIICGMKQNNPTQMESSRARNG